MGDVIHAVPVIDDIKKQFPEAEIDWLVEDVFADIPKHVNGVNEVLECSVRKWEKSPFSKSTREAVKALRQKLKDKHYDLVIDIQGLIKSSILASLAGATVSGYDKASIKEPAATLLYDKKHNVSRKESAVNRCRLLTGKTLGYVPDLSEPVFNFEFKSDADSSGEVFFFCNTSRETKLWPEENWISLGQAIAAEGKKIILPWGSEIERERVQRIRDGVGDAASVPERMSIGKLMELLSTADAVVGLDTGMTHLSSAMGRPTVGIFRDYPIELVPLVGKGKKQSLGGVACCPQVNEVLNAYKKVVE